MTIRLASLTLLAPLILLPGCARTTGEAGGAPPTAVPATPRSGAPSTASAGATYRVVQRLLEFTDPSRVTDPRPGKPGNKTQGRTLPTTIWYPAPPARGPFPLVLLSHGLLGLPSDYEAIATRWSGAGFVVVAPTYPLTSRASPQVQPLDVPNQPADASFVITAVLKLAERPSDPFHGLLDGSRVVAAGHSAGAITTVGLFTTCCRDARLLAGIVLAGNSLGFTNHFAGRPTPILFEHSDNDPIVPYWTGRLLWEGLPWPKAFVTLRGQGHIDPYLLPSSPGFAVVAATTTDFLRWSVSGDPSALNDLRRHAEMTDMAHLEDRL